jgi:hypothetical protein
VHTFGIPHEPGTPLYVLLARAWSLLLPVASTALATNLFSALCTAAAGGALAALIFRVTRSWPMALAGALCAGGMFTVWSSATETEVYAAVLLLAMLTLLAAERAGRTNEARWRALTAYALALAVPLHIGTLVAAPAAVVLIASREDGTLDWLAGARLAAVGAFAAGVGLASLPIVVCGAAALAALAIVAPRGRAETLEMLGCALLAISALAVMMVRARFDPWLNEGTPSHLGALWDAIGRRQYGVSHLWPRQAPVWAQIANWFEYADWQVALGVSNGVAPTWWRTPITIAFAMLGVAGSAAHRRAHARSWRAFVLLFACATVGLIAYLNFKAGASFGWGVLASGAPHEVRDRDYFFVLGFWVWGAWAGIGAVALARRAGAHWVPMGVLAAAAPLVLNVRAADRRSEPERSIATTVAHALLASAPPNAVLVTGGDNDSFPAWYAQAAEGMRPDVTVVVAPLLGTRWYRAQLARRASLLAPGDVDLARPAAMMLAAVAREARAQGRPVVASTMTDEATRAALGELDVIRGVVTAGRDGSNTGIVRLGDEGPYVDTVTAAALLSAIPIPAASADDDGIDPAPATMLAYLRCPSQQLAAARGAIAVASLDSLCKLR